MYYYTIELRIGLYYRPICSPIPMNKHSQEINGAMFFVFFVFQNKVCCSILYLNLFFITILSMRKNQLTRYFISEITWSGTCLWKMMWIGSILVKCPIYRGGCTHTHWCTVYTVCGDNTNIITPCLLKEASLAPGQTTSTHSQYRVLQVYACSSVIIKWEEIHKIHCH